MLKWKLLARKESPRDIRIAKKTEQNKWTMISVEGPKTSRTYIIPDVLSIINVVSTEVPITYYVCTQFTPFNLKNFGLILY